MIRRNFERDALIVKLRKNGLYQHEIARKVGVSQFAVFNALRVNGLTQTQSIASSALWKNDRYRKPLMKKISDGVMRAWKRRSSRWHDPNGKFRLVTIKNFANFQQKTKNTSIERRLQAALKENKIKFHCHPTMYGLPDIIVKPKICVFADGEYWHNRPTRIIRDRKISRKLRTLGYKVLRFPGKRINRNVGYCVNKVKEAINEKK